MKFWIIPKASRRIPTESKWAKSLLKSFVQGKNKKLLGPVIPVEELDHFI